VQPTARNAEEMADAVRQLSGEAFRLQQLVDKFRLV
jgi:methyl-accepting chemotaxis protein